MRKAIVCRHKGVALSKEKRYCIIYIRDSQHKRLLNVIEKYMPKDRGEDGQD